MGWIRYRFRGVELDINRRIVTVDGTVVPVQRRVFNLLSLLCESKGAVISRARLLDSLWGKDECPADEALTQIIFKLRSALGPYGFTVATVRNVGIRLEAEVLVSTADLPDTVLPENSHINPDPDSTPAPIMIDQYSTKAGVRLSRKSFATLAALLAGALIMLIILPIVVQHFLRHEPATHAILDEAYGLRGEDIRNGNPETISLVQQALTEYKEGRRGSAIVLMQSAHTSDSETAVPAIMLWIWVRVLEGADAGSRWKEEARKRLLSDHTAYVQMLADFAFQSGDDPDATVRTTTAMLAIRPDAWLIRYGRAHAYYRMGHSKFTLALADLQQIPVGADLDRRQVSALADRASLGDVAGANERLSSLRPNENSAIFEYLEGRLAFSQLRFAGALKHFDITVEEAANDAGSDFFNFHSALLSVICLHELGRPTEAADRLSRIAEEAGRQNALTDAFEAEIMNAQIFDELGNTILRDKLLNEAAQIFGPKPPFPYNARLSLIWWRLKHVEPPNEDPGAVLLPNSRDTAGVPQLLLSRKLLTLGKLSEARIAYDEATKSGINDTFFAEESQLIRSELKLPIEGPRMIDPPYPNISRVTALWALRRGTNAYNE